MSSNNPFKNALAKTIDTFASPIITDRVLPETRQGCSHYENRAKYFVGRDGSYGNINKDNFKQHFGKKWSDVSTYDRNTNTETPASLQSNMRKFSK